MPERDYSSIARSLAVNEPSPPQSPVAERPNWLRARSTTSILPRPASARPQTATRATMEQLKELREKAATIWGRLKWWQRTLLVIFLVGINVAVILFFVYNEQFLQWLQPKAEAWSKRTGGWLLIWFLIFVTAFPPLFGYSTAVTIAGFIYGLPNGWFIVATANVIGSTCAFLTSRYFLRNWIERKIAHDSRFAALSLVLKHDGLKLLTAIRLCPLPYSLSNGALSTFPTISPGYFALATAFATPKLVIHVFIGSRLSVIGKEGDEMDGTAKAVNYISIAGGVAIGAITGYIIWRRTQARSRQLETEEQAKLEERAAALSHPDTFADDDGGHFDDDEAPLQATHDDDIDFLDPSQREGPYQDDDGGDDAHKEEATGLQKTNHNGRD